MNLTQEEWIDIKDWLNELCNYYNNEADLYKNYRQANYFNEELAKIKAFIESKTQ